MLSDNRIIPAIKFTNKRFFMRKARISHTKRYSYSPGNPLREYAFLKKSLGFSLVSGHHSRPFSQALRSSLNCSLYLNSSLNPHP